MTRPLITRSNFKQLTPQAQAFKLFGIQKMMLQKENTLIN